MACYLCGKEKKLTKHHLIPKSVEPQFKGTKIDLTLRKLDIHNSHTVLICRKCHDLIHQKNSNTELALKFNEPEKLREWYNTIGRNYKTQPKITPKTKFNKKFKRLVEYSIRYKGEKKQEKSYKTGVIKLNIPKEEDYVSMQELIEVKRLKK